MFCERCERFESIERPLCFQCGEPLSIERKVCGVCEKSKPSFEWVRSQYHLTENAQTILHQIKFFSDYPMLSYLAETHIKDPLPLLPADTWIVPVPLNRRSFWERGFNQSHCLAKVLGNKNSFRLVPDALLKLKKTQRQSWLDISERQENLKGAFQWNPKYTPPKSILLVDDVYTTGSTFRECAKVLRKQKVEKIAAWTLFRTPKNFSHRKLDHNRG